MQSCLKKKKVIHGGMRNVKNQSAVEWSGIDVFASGELVDNLLYVQLLYKVLILARLAYNFPKNLKLVHILRLR